MDCKIHKEIFKSFGEIMKLNFLKCHNYLEKVGVFPGQSALLCNLQKKDGQSQKELCENLHVRPATITVMIKRMEKKGLIKRVQDEKDKRVSRIFLCQAGIDVLEDISKVHKEIADISFKNISHEEQEELKRILNKIRDNLREECSDDIAQIKMPMFEEHEEMKK